ncbi:MAG: site-specific integrase [Veillonella parvula]|nr:site-specific integrase [Veillonella parvula]
MVSVDLYIGIYIALETEMRLGKIMALRWNDIVIDSYTTIQRPKSEVKEQNITSPKTGIGREIQISQGLISALKEYQKIQNTYKKELEDLYENDYRIIGGLLGKGFHACHYSSRLFKQLLHRAGINRRIRFHDLRHTHATLLLLLGVNPKIVQERLGHSSINVTLDIYSHVALADQAIAITALDKLNL